MTSLHQLTLVVPTYQRAAYALRAMRYWSGHPVQMIVLDGSPEAISAVHLQGLSANIRYIHSPVSIQDRLAQACNILNTPYAALLSDDDFFASSGLELAIAELEAQRYLQCCNGNCASFNWRISEQQISTRLHYPEQIRLLHNQPAADLRISAHFRHYTPAAVYAVHRTEGFKLAMQAAAHPNSCIYSSEIAFEFVSAMLGGLKTISCCYWLRSMENEPVQTTNSDRGLRFHQWFVLPEYQYEVNNWLTFVSSLLAVHFDDNGEVKKLLQLACEQYLCFVEEHFAATHRPDRGTPACWSQTTAFIESKGISVLPEMAQILQLVENFHLTRKSATVKTEGERH